MELWRMVMAVAYEKQMSVAAWGNANILAIWEELAS